MATSDLRTQLESLRIPREHRPASGHVLGGRRWPVGGLIVLTAVGAGAYGAYTQRDRILAAVDTVREDAPEVPLMTVTVRQEHGAPPLLTAAGKIVSDHRVEVSTKVSGQVVALYFEQGDLVKKGQLLARIEDVIYRARRDEARAELEKAKANYEYQKINFARVNDLYTRGIAPEIEFADARRWLNDAESAVASHQAVLDFAQKTLDDCEVVAPIEGVVLERNVEVGDFVAAEGGRGANANAQVGTIADTSKLRVEVDISEMDISRLRKGMPCRITPDAYKDRTYDGHVMWIDPAANYSKATVQVKVRIERPDEFVRVEGSAKVNFLEESATSQPAGASGIWIPRSACRLNGDGRSGVVFVAVNDRLKAAPVVIGRRAGDQFEVASGLSAGQLIATNDVGKLNDGQRLRAKGR
ncbi:MAG: efflux RND transporter periplasmic adaptor subunit [Phycisphaerae bacterium]|nr:efflux RND transporter periplasmic adaptor subunit [Phycisphaerae bacterium]NUQ47500.1 efflux RND transporter periplasmic adaptor subunit [Phycisphaerae bacterium]